MGTICLWNIIRISQIEKEKQQRKLDKYLIIRINPKITTVRVNINDLSCPIKR